jgi:hypothetical protein
MEYRHSADLIKRISGNDSNIVREFLELHQEYYKKKVVYYD